MSSGLPVAIINGIGLFGAKKLSELLVKSDIRVIGVGEAPSGLNNLNNFEIRGELVDVSDRVDYIFDFVGDVEAWRLAERDNSKLAIIGVNRSINDLEQIQKLNVNWRVLNFHGVYGSGMDQLKEGLVEEVGYLIEAVKLAVLNNNLILPARSSRLRLLAEIDLTEAVMRGTFLSGTEGGVFEVWGGLIQAEEIAKVLIDEAKMTRFKVVEGGVVGNVPDDGEVETVWGRLRWRPEANLAESIKEVLQEAFSLADEEKRKKKVGLVESKPVFVVEREEVKVQPEKRFAVEVEPVETPTVIAEPVEKLVDLPRDDKEELKKIMDEEYKDLMETEVEIEEVETEIKPLLVKNSNSRPVRAVDPPQPVVVEKKELVENKIEDKVEVKKVNKPKVDWMKWGWRVLGVGWLVAAVMACVFVATNYGIYRNILQIKKMVGEKQYDSASLLVKKTLATVRNEESGVEVWGFNQWVWGRRYQDILKAAEQGLLLGDKVILISRKAQIISDGVFKDKDLDWKKELPALKVMVVGASDDLGLLQGRLAGDWRWLPTRWRNDLVDIKSQLAETNKLVSLSGQVVDVLPELLGVDGKRREYMVLFQNESELRPGGGFIGSYGILSFEGGALKNFEIKDVYEADGQLKGHVEPPEAIKNYLGEAEWYMRDANWQADFGSSSKDIQWFLEKETGRKVDGVIGINLAVAKSILSVVGEVYVPDFKEKINASNLYEQAEFYSETNSFPGSVQKASFLGGLGKQLFEEIKNLKGEEQWKMLEAIIGLAEKNEIQLALNEKTAAATLNDLGWNGGMYQGTCPAQVGQNGCFADYLYIVEANLGVNKANYFLYRNIDQVVEIGDKTISRVVKINYENNAKNNNWPGGDYKNYVRVYIPSTSNLAEVSVTDLSKGGVKTIYSGDSLKMGMVKGRKEIGFLVVVPVGSKRVVEIRYLDQVAVSSRFTYKNYIQKQSGYGDTGLVSLVTIPEGWTVNQVEPAATLVGGKLLFNQKLDRDIKMGVDIGR